MPQVRKDNNKSSIIIPSLGTLYQVTKDKKTSWFGRVRGISPTNEVELTINTIENSHPSQDQLNLIKNLSVDYDFLINLLLTHLKKTINRTSPEISIDNLKEMYFLTAVELTANKNELWFTLEPGDVATPFNFFPRFTVVDNKIQWSNVS
jgi:hypothetical protein